MNKTVQRVLIWTCLIANSFPTSALASLPEFRSIDGTGNNAANSTWGSAGIQFLRQSPSVYGDGLNTPSGSTMPNARDVSYPMMMSTESTVDPHGHTDMLWLWGQFLDHDIDLTEGASPDEHFDIAIPTGDPFFDPLSTGTMTMELKRSKFDPATGITTPREQMNSITSFIDASQVYGSNTVRAAALRTFTEGKMKTSAGNLLPFNTPGLPNAPHTGASLFLAGDVRANEHNGLTALQTLFVREHNRLAEEIAEDDSGLSDEEIYQLARRKVGAIIQSISYNEFLPELLGPGAISTYSGYNPGVNASISNMFATVAYRMGHSMLSSTILRLNNDGSVISHGNLSLRDAFFRPDRIINEGGIDPLLKGFSSQKMQAMDMKAVQDVVNFLFGPPGAGGLDLMALDIQRARDHGIADYNTVREDFGLPAVNSFSDITMDAAVAAKLEALYGTVDNIDVFVGMVGEDHMPTNGVGLLLYTILKDQFMRLRDGDRFWYERTFSGLELVKIRSTKLSDVIKRNTDLTNIQSNVFKLSTFSNFFDEPDLNLPDFLPEPTIEFPEFPDFPTLPSLPPIIPSLPGFSSLPTSEAGNIPTTTSIQIRNFNRGNTILIQPLSEFQKLFRR